MPLSHIQKCPGDPLDLDEAVDLPGIVGDLLQAAQLAASALGTPQGEAISRVIYVAEDDLAAAKAAVEGVLAAAGPAAAAGDPSAYGEARHGRR